MGEGLELVVAFKSLTHYRCAIFVDYDLRVFFFTDMSQRMIAETSMHISLTALEPTPTLKLTVPSHWDNVTGTLHVEVILYFCESSGLCKMESLLFNIPFVCQINGEKTVNCMLQHSVCAS